MMGSDCDSLNFNAGSFKNDPYNHSLALSASSPLTSVFSEASSQVSDNTSISTSDSDSEYCNSYHVSHHIKPSQAAHLPVLNQSTECAQVFRKNPRRSGTARNGPPTLARQSDRKVIFVDSLVDSSTQIVEAIWPLASVFHRQEIGHKAVLPLRTFIQETLRRSRTSYSTFQVALYYLILIKPHVPNHDFTMEQPEDFYAVRALQCGRRMFLAALILASKYLQDRNYSAKAWSKISGLATEEINQNEMVFLNAVNWRLHITDTVYKRWTEVLLSHNASQPPSSGSGCLPISEQQQTLDWKNLILQLEPGLENVGDLLPIDKTRVPPSRTASLSRFEPHSSIEIPISPLRSQTIATPTVMEPVPAGVSTPGRFAPALGLLPTPRLTPQSTGLCTPAVTTATALLGGRCSMGFAMAQVAQTSVSQSLDKWPGSIHTSPHNYMLTRRPSLASSISSASSPESMVSDTSRTSRSSSISSASSLASAPSVKLDIQARCRNAKLYGERFSMKPTIASVPEDCKENCITSSPESYAGTAYKDFCELFSDSASLKRDCDVEDAADAARVLQELNNYRNLKPQAISAPRPNLKRSRRVSTDESLQQNVRNMLNNHQYVPQGDETKRLRCSAESNIHHQYMIPAIHTAVGGPGGPGMWAGILN
ncbi:hypothetical protein F4808DRAFT_458069 [Astrocystis sublimbata]|nr:hypothetical protein F4808DRAFT_458069 [Astrocystis sublimbata]